MSHRKKIYIAYTGGTIGMMRSEQGYVPAPGFLEQSLKGMPEFYRPEMPEFELCEYDPLMDSSDMSPRDWQRIASDIESKYDDYDGFVVLHGTDTMAYTASALSFMFENLNKPVIVTGSQIPLAALRSDGQVNLLNSLYIAAHYPIPEVGLFFNHYLFRGNRATKADADGFDAFASPNFPALIEAGIDIELVAGKIQESNGEKLRVQQVTAQEIGVVTLYPGMSSTIIDSLINQPVKALIIKSFGVGNAPHKGPLIEAIGRAVDANIPVINITQCFKGTVNMSGYATGNALADMGVLSGEDLTVEAALTKLHYLLSKGISDKQLAFEFARNLRGELSN
ncbi:MULTISPECIES: asparaginase [Gammaproteobacteria]|uniref:asparaginase n=1 Tax=Gammaproteobacteria TaxID=1236 RepID=UPI000DD054F9|nr:MULTISPECIES: asparaginase [Gammaproteobacteria]RTE87272.1 L-asparaginase 1 [Aliidiomarina sp. B3213]TCZ92941.1 L-asparaginase 1 [Lysobacter sp. N42]